MLPSDEEKAYIVSYCKTDGSSNSACLKCDKEDHQPNCSFFEKGSFNKKCSHIRMGEYCSNFHACDFSDGKPVHVENIPNMPKMKKFREFIDTAHGRREIFRDQEYHGRRRRLYKRESGPSSRYPSGLQEVKEVVRRTYHDEHNVLRDSETGERVIQFANPCKEVDLSGKMSDIMGEYEKLEDEMDKFPILNEDGTIGFVMAKEKEITVAVDNSGCMTPERFHELADMLAETLRDQTLCTFYPVTKHVTKQYLYECFDSYCAAYSEEFKLFLDMSCQNLYTIYNANGNFISLRKLLEDGITPFQMNFKFKNGDTCLEEYGFESFVDMIEPMLTQGR